MAKTNYSYEKRKRELEKQKKKAEKLKKKQLRKQGIEDPKGNDNSQETETTE